MSHMIPLPTAVNPNNDIQLSNGQILFVVGPNGAGKSRLMQNIYARNPQNAIRIAAHRQIFFGSHSVSLSAAERININGFFQNNDSSWERSIYDSYAEKRINALLFDLVDAENVRARAIAAAFQIGDHTNGQRLIAENSPVHLINEILRLSNIPIDIEIQPQDTIMARKSGSAAYGINKLSDGEKNALLIIASVLTAKSGTLLVIDEPERHLHHSISAPLLSTLFSMRPDCAFVVSTHDIQLPIKNANTATLLVRGCQITNGSLQYFDVDLLPADAPIDEQMKEDILGARRSMLFIEGTQSSLDLPLYSLLFPQISVVPKDSCRNVGQSVTTIRSEQELHWLNAFGIIDRDGKTQQEVDALKPTGIYALSFYSVEAIYYHPEIQRHLAERQAQLLGGNAQDYLTRALTAALQAIQNQADHLSRRLAEKTAREQVFQHLPTQQTMRQAAPITVNIDVAAIIQQERTQLTTWVQQSDFLRLLQRYPLRETGALAQIATNLQFTNRTNYQNAVIRLLVDDSSARAFAIALFDGLDTAMGI